MKLETLKMSLKSLKSRVNNQKACLFKGKSAKITAAFNKNKPNLKNIKVVVSPSETSKYEILPAGSGKKTNPSKANLSQNKANSNPIFGMAKFALSSFLTSKYEKFEDSAGKKQTQTNPTGAKRKS